MKDPVFKVQYDLTEMPPLAELPFGAILGTALLHSCDPVDEELVEDLTEMEQAFGWFALGRFAWRLRDPRPFPHPIVARGQQGVWDYNAHGVLQIPD